MKTLLKIWISVWNFVKQYPELLSIPVAVGIWIASCYVLRVFDYKAGIFDAGVFQIPLFAILQLVVYVSIAWLLMRLVFGTLAEHLMTGFKEEFDKLTEWQKLIISYGVYFALFYALVLLSHTLIASR